MTTPVLTRQRVLSGMRPTGALHLGHYHGALKNWVRLQDSHDCFFFVADWHALTTQRPSGETLARHAYDMVTDWLAAGVDPERCTLFLQSRMPEHAELFTLLAMCAPSSWLARMPSYKDQVAADPELATYGFLGYPLLQAADILLYKPAGVPVGEDQAAHVEVTREVARRFNRLYAADAPVFVEPQALLTETARMPGLDGQKMSKSADNAIAMRDSPEATATKIRTMPTDPQRVRRDDAGDPARCPVWPLHVIYTDEATRKACDTGCRTASIGCLDCKQPLIEAIQKEQAPWRERAAALDPQQVKWTLELGTERARAVARKTLREVRAAMGLVA
ncbi:tryptophan--tRNA ligase [Roseateles asaccharophilus]|uniref:Tryptophan--tRNA ligase n=1 Tax=Roseateles asaccharophilus TaxID=582607 RepID=A0ABU2ABT9_9BURK|nr:tryptophan--tRNA ligase [Roseateles asaccharophilus]MDR7334063.1 tryptophanyl-tRNA synthetase [Roseateles asaccharophilus]